MNLDELTALENEWLSKQPEGGFIEERDALYKRIGMYEAWGKIFEQYVLLARQGNLEALKRALYLAWAEHSQAFFLTGIKNLDTELVREVLQMVNDLAKNDQLDTELRWMLPWYYHIAPQYLDFFDDLEDLKEVSGGDWYLYQEGCLESSFANRGQLGKYWRSIQKKYKPD